MTRNNEEWLTQQSFNTWVEQNMYDDKHPNKPYIVLSGWAVPNGLKSTPVNVKMMKLIGMRKGIADYHLILKNGKYVVIEFKAAKGKLSPEQEIFLKCCNMANIPNLVTSSCFEAKNFVVEQAKI